jgi:hypothetical protein
MNIRVPYKGALCFMSWVEQVVEPSVRCINGNHGLGTRCCDRFVCQIVYARACTSQSDDSF